MVLPFSPQQSEDEGVVLLPLNDTVHIFTGAGSGLGRRAARLFAKQVANVASVDVDVAAA